MKKLIDFIARSKGLKTNFDIKKDLAPYEKVKNILLSWFPEDEKVMYNYLITDENDYCNHYDATLIFFILYPSSLGNELYLYNVCIYNEDKYEIKIEEKFIFLNEHYYMVFSDDGCHYDCIEIYKYKGNKNIYFDCHTDYDTLIFGKYYKPKNINLLDYYYKNIDSKNGYNIECDKNGSNIINKTYIIDVGLPDNDSHDFKYKYINDYIYVYKIFGRFKNFKMSVLVYKLIKLFI